MILEQFTKEYIVEKKLFPYIPFYIGYICLQYSFLWGALGFLAVRFGNGIILGCYHSLPAIVGKVLIWGLMAVGAVDFAGSFMAIYHLEEKLPRLLGWNHSLQRLRFRLA